MKKPNEKCLLNDLQKKINGNLLGETRNDLDSLRSHGGTGDYELNELIETYVYEGILFQKVKEFKLIYDGYISETKNI